MILQSKLFQKCILNSMRAITNSVMSHHHEKWALHCVGKRFTGGDVNSVIFQGDWNWAEVAPRFCPYKFLLQSIFIGWEYKGSKYGIRYLLLYSKTSGHGTHTYKSLKWDRDTESEWGGQVVSVWKYPCGDGPSHWFPGPWWPVAQTQAAHFPSNIVLELIGIG